MSINAFQRFWWVYPTLVLIAAGSARAFAAEPIEEVRALVDYAQHREDLVQQGIRWQWTVTRGVCQSIEDGWKGAFDKDFPIDVYACRWLSNDERFLYESIAQQDVRVLSRDKNQNVITTTNGSEAYLATQNSRLLFLPNSFSGLDGQVQSRLRGFSSQWGPDSVSLHGGIFGMGSSRNLLEFVSKSKSTLTIDRGTTTTGVDSKVVRYEAPSGLSGDFYFSTSELTLLQSDQFRDNVLRRRTVVLDTRTLSDGDRELEIPVIAVSCMRRENGDSWQVRRLTTDKVQLERVPLAEMSVQVNNADVELHPTFGLRPVGAVENVTAETLDDFVENLFIKAEREQRARKNRKRSTVLQAEPSSWRKYLVAINVAVLAVGICLYVYSRRMRQSSASSR